MKLHLTPLVHLHARSLDARIGVLHFYASLGFNILKKFSGNKKEILVNFWLVKGNVFLYGVHSSVTKTSPLYSLGV